MEIGSALFLIAAGAILRYAVTAERCVGGVMQTGYWLFGTKGKYESLRRTI